jgi:hypothetical protein
MNKTKIFGLLVGASLFAVACNNDADTTAKNDSTNATGTEITSNTTTTDYAAKADEFQKNSEAGRYRDARTGKPIKINVDRTTGARINAETNEPVRRYVIADTDTDWWLYDETDSRLGRVRWDSNKMMYEDNGNWIDYETRWKDDEVKVKVDEGDGDVKAKSDDAKVKIDKDGDTKIKTKDQKIKIDKDGSTKVKDN